jgi:multidrug efflux system membrane fusion protein
VSVASVVRRDAPVTLHAIGRVEAYATVAVKAQVEGQLARLHFAEGQEVKRGDLLFEIDPRPFEAALHQAEAMLAKNRAEAANARVESGRLASLIKSGVVSRDEYDQAATRAAAFEAASKADDAAVERARIQLQYCTIHAPIDGRIGQMLVHEGNVVEANETTLAVINQLRPVRVAFAVPQQELPAVRANRGANGLPVSASGAGGAVATGELSFIDNAIDTTTGTVLLKAVFANVDETLWPGQFVDVALQLTTRPNALLVPARAVQSGQAGQFVFVVTSAGTVASRPVTTGPSVGDDVVVESGLEAGEQVVTEGHLRLAPGFPVTVKAAG